MARTLPGDLTLSINYKGRHVRFESVERITGERHFGSWEDLLDAISEGRAIRPNDTVTIDADLILRVLEAESRPL